MKLKVIGSNKTEVTLSSGTQVFFSYNTPVAAWTLDSGYIRTEKIWSMTTSRHINQWLDGIDARLVSQEHLDKLV